MTAMTRRSVLASSVALAACGQSVPSIPDQSGFGANIAGVGEIRQIRGRGLYVETAGERSAPPVLYLHGGPGAGSYDFSVTQAGLLAERLHVIMVDQRGVLRSDALADDETCTLTDLVEDTEALRESLGIRRWAVIGHSFGGFLALAYTLAYPNSVSRAVFENPCWDLESSARELLRGAGIEYAALGDDANARACAEAAAASTDARGTWDAFSRLTNQMGDARDNIYVHGPEKNFFSRLVQTSGIPEENWGRAGTHQRKLFDEGAVFTPVAPRLPDLRAPALLIHGRYDRVNAPDQVAAFGAGAGRTRATFENSSHFAHVEEPELFARTVAEFVSA
jgi:proline iminopeptidase